MQYNNKFLLLDFAQRTKANLDCINDTVKNEPNKEVYEITQLINSLLGLLVFPFEHLKEQIPEKTLGELEEEGWIIPKVRGEFEQVKNLWELISYLRNSVSHFNIDFVPDGKNEIKSLIVCNKEWNKETRKYDKPNWKEEVTIEGLRNNVDGFLKLLLEPDE